MPQNALTLPGGGVFDAFSSARQNALLQQQAQMQAQDQQMAAQEQRGMANTQGKIEGALMSGDRDTARTLAQGSGNAEVMSQYQEAIAQMDTQQREAARERARAFAGIGASLLQIPYEQRQAALSNPAVQQQLAAYGIEPGQLTGFDPTDGNIQAVIGPVAEIGELLERTESFTLGENDTRVDPVTGRQIMGDAGVAARELEAQANETARMRASQPRGPGVVVNTGSNQPDPFQTALAESEAEVYASFIPQAQQAARNMGRIDQLETLLQEGGTGASGRLRLLAGDLGVNTEGLSQLQAAEAIISQMVPEQRSPGSGVMSDADLDLYRRSLPRIINQPGGNQIIIDTLRGIMEYDLALGGIAQRAASREITREEARAEVNALSNPVDRIRRFEAGAGQGSPQDAAPAGVDPADWQFMSPEERALFLNQ